MFHRGEPLTETVWEKWMLGLSMRKYGNAVREFTEAYGLEKSAISEHFIEASRAKLKALMERRLDKVRLCAWMIDATPFQGQQMVVALGIGEDVRKTILGIRQGATETRPLWASYWTTCWSADWISPSRGSTFWMAARR